MAKRRVSDIPCSVEGCGRPMVCRGYCNPHYQRMYHHGDPSGGTRPVGATPSTACAVAGCKMAPRSTYAKYCEMHNGRLRRNGTLERLDPRVASRLQHSGGYVLVYAPNHPMTTEGYRARPYEHRALFFDAYGAGPHSCHVCGEIGMLADMHVDHLNDVRDDNRLENLKPACPECNQWRTKSRVDVCRKKRATRLLRFNGEEMSASQWAKRVGISASALTFRLRNDWPLDRALTEPRGVTGPQAKRERVAIPK